MAATYIDISVLADVSPLLLASEPAIVWSDQLDSVLWANAAGVRLLGYEALSDVLSEDFDFVDESCPAGIILAELIAHHEDDVSEAAETFPMQLNAQDELNVACLPIQLNEEHYAILTVFYAQTKEPLQSINVQAERLAVLFGNQPGCAAVLNAQFMPVASSGGMKLDEFDKNDLAQMGEALADNNLIKRTIRSKQGAHPAGIAKTSNGFSLLLVASEAIDASKDEAPLSNTDISENDQNKSEQNQPAEYSADVSVSANVSEDNVPSVDIADMARIKNALAGLGGSKSSEPNTPISDQGFPKEGQQQEISQDTNEGTQKGLHKDSDQNSLPSFFEGKNYWYLKKSQTSDGTKNDEDVSSDIKAPISFEDDDAFEAGHDNHPNDNADVLEVSSEVLDTQVDAEAEAIALIEEAEQQLEEPQIQEPISDEVVVTPVFGVRPDSSVTSVETKAKIPAVKFAFNTDIHGNVTNVSPELETQVGRHFSSLKGRSWADIAADFEFDHDGEIKQCLDGNETWSGKSVLWPIQYTSNHVPVDLSALPNFSKKTGFLGFRGFGVIRAADVSYDPAERGLKGGNIDIDAVESAPDQSQVESTIQEPQAAEQASPITQVSQLELDRHNSVPIFANANNKAQNEAHNKDSISDDEASSDTLENDTLENSEFDNDAFGIDILARNSVEVLAANRRNKGDISHQNRIELVEELGLDDVQADNAAQKDEPAQELSIMSEEENSGQDVNSDEQVEVQGEVSSDDEQKMQEIAQHLLAVNEQSIDEVELSEAADEIAHEVADEIAHEIHSDVDLEAALQAVENSAQFNEQQQASSDNILAVIEEDTSQQTEVSSSDELVLNQEILQLSTSPVAALCYFNEELLLANQPLLDMSGYESLEDLSQAGGLDSLLSANADFDNGQMALTTKSGEQLPVMANLQSLNLTDDLSQEEFQNEDLPRTKALIIKFTQREDNLLHQSNEPVIPHSEASSNQLSGENDLSASLKLGLSVQQLHDVLETATDGVVVLNSEGEIHALNSSAEALFGFSSETVSGKSFTSLFAPDWQPAAQDYLATIKQGGVSAVMNDGRELTGFEISGGLIPMFVTLGRLAGRQQDIPGGFCAVLRDLTQWKKVESELIEARKQAEEANDEKSQFLARVSHEIRTPLNAIIGFSEIIAGERFGPLGNARYREYVRDINSSGSHVLKLVNDLLDISKIEAGAWELDRASIDMNSVVASCVSMMQAEAGQARVLMRTSLSNSVPFIEADETAFRQIVINLLSNAVKFTGEGGQVIISTAVMNNGEVELRIRDTGQGMSSKDIKEALQPYRQLSTTAPANNVKGTGLGLPLTKAMAEANGAEFAIHSEVGQGTWVVVAFPKEFVILPNQPDA